MRRRIRRLPPVLFAVACAALACAVGGCGRGGASAVVEGTVLLNGQPLADAQVQLLPRGDDGLGAHTATTDAGGHFTIRADAANNPVKPGPYVVVVTKLAMKSGAAGMGALVNEVPPVYQARARTPLTVEVQPGANQLPPFDLKQARAQRR